MLKIVLRSFVLELFISRSSSFLLGQVYQVIPRKDQITWQYHILGKIFSQKIAVFLIRLVKIFSENIPTKPPFFLIRFGRCRIFLLAQIPKFRFLDVSFSTDKYLTNCTNQSVLAIRFQLLEKFTTTFVKQYSKILLVIMLILMNIRILMMLFF